MHSRSRTNAPHGRTRLRRKYARSRLPDRRPNQQLVTAVWRIIRTLDLDPMGPKLAIAPVLEARQRSCDSRAPHAPIGDREHANHVGLKVKPTNHSRPGATGPAPRRTRQLAATPEINGRASNHRDTRGPCLLNSGSCSVFGRCPQLLPGCVALGSGTVGMVSPITCWETGAQRIPDGQQTLLEQRSSPDPTGIGVIAAAHCRCVEDRAGAIS
jgi:hypothetical protein